MIRLKILFVLGALALAGCAEDRFVGRPDLTLQRTGDLPPPTRQDLILQQRAYVIGPQDRVAIDVYGLPELSRTVAVDASGVIALPLVGIVEAAGKSPVELSAAIADRLRGRYVRDPQVTVNVDTTSQIVTVEGAVEAPGLYPIIGRMTLLRAIASAKGLSEFGRSNYIVVFRQVDNKKLAAIYDLRAIRTGAYEDPEIFPNDLVSVGDSARARRFKDLLQVAPLLTTPLILLLQ